MSARLFVRRDGTGPRAGLMARAALCAVLGLTAAACGSDGGGGKVATAGSASAQPSGSASPGNSDPDNEQENLLNYSRCMRENGVPQFPDPVAKGEGFSLSLPEGTDRTAVEKAEVACKHLLPNGGENKPVDPEIAARNRELAKCMRDNGVTNFPDPAADGSLQVQASPGSGLEPGDPIFEAASKKCDMLPAGEGSLSDEAEE